MLSSVTAVCIKVVNDIKTAAAGKKNLEEIEGILQKVCTKAATPQEKKLVRLLCEEGACMSMCL